ncbi:hypothetical protein JCM8547_001274 [Rhodosporidiobolus lusitaniae]
MSGWDDYVQGGQGGEAHRPQALAIPTQGFEDGPIYQHGQDEETDAPIFTLGQVQFTLPSSLFSLSCTSNTLVLAVTGTQPSSSSSSSASSTTPQLIRIHLDSPTEVETYTLPLPSPAPSSSSRDTAPPPPRPQLHAVHVDPTGRHALVSLTSGDGFYLFVGALPPSLPASSSSHSSAAAAAQAYSAAVAAVRKPKPLTRLKGAVISSVAWAPSPSSSSSSQSSSSFSTRPILLGTTSGQLLETLLLDPALSALDPSSHSSSAFSLPLNVPGRSQQGPEKYVKQLYTLPAREEVVGLRYEVFPAPSSSSGSGGEGGRRGKKAQGQRRNVAVAAATKTRVYQLVGTTSGEGAGAGEGGGSREQEEQGWLEEVVRPYAADEVRPKTLELPGEPPFSELHFFAPPRSDGKGLEKPKTMAWMTGPGIYHSHLLFSSSSDLPPGEGIIDSASLIPYPSLSSGSGDEEEQQEQPISMALTEFHFVLLYRERVVAVDLLTDRVVWEEVLELPDSSPPLRLSTDPISRTLWLHTATSIFELVVRDEDRYVWRVHLKRGEFEKARRAAKTPAHRSLVLASEADSFFSSGRFIQAAQSYAQTDAQSFEEVVLRFVEKGERDALRYYLVAKLERLGKGDLTPRTLIATWLVELYLAKLNELDDLAAAASGRAADDDADNFKAERAMVEEDMRGFLRTYKDNLDPRTTFDLLAQHGHDDLTLHYASVVGDHARIVQQHVAAREWAKALQALGRQEDLEIYYRHASVLIRHAPKEAVDTFLRQPRLSVRRLIPALTAPRPPSSSSAPDSCYTSTEHLIRYLLHAVQQQANTDAAVHNTLVTLFATSPSSSSSSPSTSESAFVRFLESAPTNPHTHDPYYDLDYALRLCRSHGRTQACVVIYSKMGLYDESVELALEQDDLELAKVCADKPEEDELLRKKLWLKVARYVVGKKNDIKAAMRFLDSTPLLKIEDILPFFPDFVVIDDFKDEICDALESYAAHIEQLKGDMGDATRAADAIKGDIADLNQRFVVVDAGEQCGACGLQLLTRQFYVFPCQHCFHADCLIQEVTKTLTPSQLRRMLSLQSRLAPSAAPSARQQRHVARLSALDDALSSSAAASTAGLKLAAQASVQAVDQLRKLVLPDALLSAIGGAVPTLPGVPGVGGLGGGGAASHGLNGRATAAGGGGWTTDATSLAQSASARREAKEKLALREQLDELLARECVLCEGAIASIDKGFVEEGEGM